MATYDLYEELKKRDEAAAQAKAGADLEEEMRLDDVARVKVLSPGRLCRTFTLEAMEKPLPSHCTSRYLESSFKNAPVPRSK